MRGIAFIIGLALGAALLASQGAHAQGATQATVVSSCGSASYTAGTNKNITQDTTGKSCTSSTGGGGGDVNLTGINGVAPAVGNGTTNTGTLRVTVSSDSTGTVTNPSIGANGSAVKTSSTLAGVSDGTNQQQVVAPIALGDGVNGNNMVSTGGWVWNGTTWDRMAGTAAGGVKITNAGVAQGSTTSGQTVQPIGCRTLSSLPTDTTAQTNMPACTTSGELSTHDASLLSAVNSAIPAGTNVIGYTSNDACSQSTKSGGVINLTASGQIITGTAAKKTYICSIDLITATAQNIALVEGTGSTCATNIFGLAGGTTAATGWNLAANGGISKGSGSGTVYSPSADTNATAANICILLSSTGQTSGQITYVQQ